MARTSRPRPRWCWPGETFENVDDVQREDGWIVLFRGPEAILRLQEVHVQSMERLDP